MTTSPICHPTGTLPRPSWPAAPFDSGRARVSYDVPADELLDYFDRDRPSGGICDPIGLAEGTIGVVYDGQIGEIVGIQGIPFLLGAVRHRPAWAALAWGTLAGELGRQTLHQALNGFVAEAANAFSQHGLVGVPLTKLAIGAPRPRSALASSLAARRARAESRQLVKERGRGLGTVGVRDGDG